MKALGAFALCGLGGTVSGLLLEEQVNYDYDAITERYKAASEKWLKKYSRFGNEKANSPQSSMNISLYFEFQWGDRPITPSTFLDVKGIDLGDKTCEGAGPLFPQESTWFGLSSDDSVSGDKPTFIMKELETVTATPEEYLKSDLIPSVKRYFESEQKGSPVLMQYTVGLPLSAVPTLLRESAAKLFQARTDQVCANMPKDYQALVSLAAMTVYSVGRPAEVTTCSHSKAYLEPWLVRTHFGDIAQYVASTHGSKVLDRLAKDVFEVSGISPHAPSFPGGLRPYRKLFEVAEESGLVVSRNMTLNRLARPRLDVPTTLEELCKFADRLLEKEDTTGSVPSLRGYTECIKPNDPTALERWPASPRAWLDGVVHGKDLWTDGESAMSRDHMTFKSMGAWRMGKRGHVFLESRKRKGHGSSQLKAHGFPTSGFGIPRDSLRPDISMIDIVKKTIDTLM